MTEPTPVTFEDLKAQRWFPQVDDLVGGAIVSNVDKPASSIDVEAGDRVMAWGVWPEFARHVAAVHNAHLAGLADLARMAQEVDPDDYDEGSPEGKYDLAFDEGHATGSATAVRPIVALIFETALNAVGILENTPGIDHAAHLATLIAGLSAAVEPLATHQLPADLKQEIYDASESIGWWELAEFLGKRPRAAYEFLAEYAPDRLVVEGDG